MKNIRDYGFIVEENTRHLLGDVYDILIKEGENTYRRYKYNFERYNLGEVIGNINDLYWQGLDKKRDNRITVLSIPEFINLFSKLNLKITDMEIYKERTIEINGKLRQVIISVVAVGQKLHAGYAITHIDDKFDEKIGKLVAKGRALNERTNLVDMELGKGMDKKFILYSVADHIFKQLENGKITVKGVK